MSNTAPRIETVLEQSEAMPMRDPDIRAPLHFWLRAAHADCPDTEILHELRMPRPSARIDLAVINGELCGFEIKSDADSLSRLPRQSRAFSAVFDRVSVVTTERHVSAVQNIVPNWWGIVLANPRNFAEAFSIARRAEINPELSKAALLYMLSRKELIGLLEANELIAGLRSKPRVRMIDVALSHLSEEKIGSEVKGLFKARAARHRLRSS